LELSSSVKMAGSPLAPSGDAVLSSVLMNACVSSVSDAVLHHQNSRQMDRTQDSGLNH
jgi:hypothetical protein